jgi:hypothetical protein
MSQAFESPVNGRRVHCGKARADLLEHLVRGKVGVFVGEGFQDNLIYR